MVSFVCEYKPFVVFYLYVGSIVFMSESGLVYLNK
jgi:hypothetical protein